MTDDDGQLLLVIGREGGRIEYQTTSEERAVFVDAYDHCESLCESLNGDEAVYYRAGRGRS